MTWKRKLGWIGISILALILIVALGGYLVLRGAVLHHYLLAKIEQKASESTGAQIQIQNFDVHLSGLTADAYGITVHGKEPAAAPPLAQADQFTIRLKIVSLLHKKIDLKELILRHPVVNLRVNKDGSTNLPTPPKSNNNSSTDPFDLGIQHVSLTGGEVYYNDVKTPLDADLHELLLEIKSRFASKTYDGTLSYRDGHLRYGDSRPLPHDLNAAFSTTPSEFQLKPLVLSVATSKIELQGSVQNYAQPSLQGTYRFTIHPQDFRAALKNPTLPAGEITLAGSMRYQYDASAPMIRTVAVDGRLNSRELLVDTPEFRGAIRNLEGQLKLANGNLSAHGFAADLLGGHLIADATMRNLGTNRGSGQVRASVQSISLGGTKTALRTANLRQVPLEGNLSGNVDASWVGSVQNANARSDVTFKGAIARANESNKVPLDGSVHVTYDGRKKLATLANTFARTPQTSVTINGTAGDRLNLMLQAHAGDLHELDSLAAAFQNAGTAKPMNLAGAADAHITVQGRKEDPRISGQLNGRDLQVQNTAWKTFGAHLQASKSSVAVQNGSLVNSRQGYVNFSATVGLSNWHYSESSPLTANVTSRGLAVQQLLQVAKLNYPVSGNLSVDVNFHGSQLNPAGNGSVRVFQAKVYGQPMQQLSLQFNGDGNALNTALNVSTTAGSAKANLIFNPKSKAYEVHLDAPGIQLAKLQPVQDRNAGINGALTVSANGKGTLNNPQLTASVQIPQLQVRQKSISGFKADLNVANHQADVSVDSQVAESYVKAHGTVDLKDGYYARASFDTKQIPIEALLAMFGPERANGPTGILEVHGTAEGPLKDKTRMQAQLQIPTLKAEYQGMQIGNTRPIRVRYANSLVVLDPTEIAGTDTSIKLQGQLPLRGNAAVTMAANGSVDMQLLRFFNPDIQSSGKLLLDARATGAAGRPQIAGQVRLQNIALAYPDAPIGVQNLNGVLDIANDKVTITQLAGESGGGQISATGLIAYRPQLQMNVAMKARNVRIRYQDQIRTLLDSDLNLVGTTEASNLTGRVLINSLSFTPNFDLAALGSSVESGPESAPSQGMAQNLKLNVTVQTSRDLNASSSQVSLQGSANLQVIGTAANPVIIGRTDFTAGDIFLMNQRYQIQRGVIQFSNPNRTEPVLNIVLTTTISQYNLNLTFIGPLDKMQTSYVSDPPLPTADIVNLIRSGQTTEQASNSPSSLGATSLLARGAASEVSSGIQKLAGFSSFSIDPTLGGNNADPGARIAFQKRITSALLLTFATDVTNSQREIIQGEYQFNKRWSASVTRDENGGFAVDGKFHKRF